VASLRKQLQRVAVAGLALLLLLYAGDDFWVRYRMRSPKQGNPLDSVISYYATALKNGKIEVFYDQPITRMCVHSIFPHLGYMPCWYLRRSAITRIP
jgi:hypothetical protein